MMMLQLEKGKLGGKGSEQTGCVVGEPTALRQVERDEMGVCGEGGRGGVGDVGIPGNVKISEGRTGSERTDEAIGDPQAVVHLERGEGGEGSDGSRAGGVQPLAAPQVEGAELTGKDSRQGSDARVADPRAPLKAEGRYAGIIVGEGGVSARDVPRRADMIEYMIH
jgi:hypothetical protein